MKDWYTYVMLALVGNLLLVQLNGGGANDGVKAPLEGGRSVRNNPGSYRSHYSSGYYHIGGK